ncbi:uncharacterized protein LOC131873949 [Cryptomeria japonica]|uniref:uncharacterized protein LOC131873949 n=1 Tax=Cryptomeria japonica TaxID=3369 RepID=UPI0027DA24D3|nr:uncharacterized protein LOC131873949 [Cryptomeria japonica]
MSREAFQYYSTLFSDDVPQAPMEENMILAYIPLMVTNVINESLSSQVSLSELEEVVFGMTKSKAPRPDGFPVEFFQEFWDIIKLDLLAVGGFVVGRKILDRVVIASEVLHSMYVSRERAMFIKLDMAKAYDRVNWSLLRKVLLAFGFTLEWASWVISCVTSVSIYVLINGEPSQLFGASRGFAARL